MSGRVLVVTGANGFVGTHVAALAASQGVEVWGIGREATPSATLSPFVSNYYSADLEHEWPAHGAVDAIIHLAGLAAVGPSFAYPQRYLSVNSGIVTTMCESILESSARPRIVVASTGAVYAPPSAGTAGLDESSPTVPTSPYAVAKLLVEDQALYYAGRGIDTVVARPFNHIGPGQGPGFLIPDLTEQLFATQPGVPLAVGNLDTARDYTDVRDVAAAYLRLAFADKHDAHVYNVASGESRSGWEVLAAIAAALGRDIPEAIVDPARIRPNDVLDIRGDSTLLREEFGWQPAISWQTSIADYLAGRR